MELLFCRDWDTEDRRPPEESFLLRRAPASMTDALEKAREDRERGTGWHKVLSIVLIVLWLACWGLTAYLNAGGRYGDSFGSEELRLSGILLALGAVTVALTAIERLLRKRRRGAESEMQKRVDSAERALREYMGIPEDAVRVDILSFGHREGKEYPAAGSDPLNCEMFLFEQDDALCLLDSSGLYSFPRSGLRDIRVVKRTIPVRNWNKEFPPTRGWLRKYGVDSRSDGEQTYLRFFCALDILTPFGKSFCLLFPAYELDVIAGLTGLAGPALLR